MITGGTSAGQLLQLFRTGQVSTRRELQTLTGLARSTVTFRVDALLAAGYLVEDGVTTDAGRGRPATRLRLNDQQPTVLAADLGATRGRLAVCTAGGEVLHQEVIESDIGSGPTQVLARVEHVLRQVLRESGRPLDSLAGIGVGVPGRVRLDGRIARSISMAGWDDYPVADHVRERFAVPVVVDNDANLLGLGEQSAEHPDAHLMLFVKVGTGIGAAILVDGQVLRGRHAAEGDIGHVKIGGVEEVCSCGAVGCLAATASGRALVRDLNRLGHATRTSRDVVSLVRQGDPDAVRLVTEAGRRLGSVLSTAVSLLNPEVVVIGGDIAHAHEQLLGGVRETLLSRTQPLATAHLTVVPSRLQDQAGIAGAALMVRDRIFGAEAVDAELERRAGSGTREQSPSTSSTRDQMTSTGGREQVTSAS
ncbi:MAG: ROK family protein [Actinomycetes bacterium]